MYQVVQCDDHAPIFHMVGLGIPWAQVLAWISQYGLPLLVQVLQLVLSGGFNGLTIAQLIAWITGLLKNGGRPIPVPAPVP